MRFEWSEVKIKSCQNLYAIINHCKPLTSVFLERWILHCVRWRFIHRSCSSNRRWCWQPITAQCVQHSEIQDVFSKNHACQRFVVIIMLCWMKVVERT